MDPLFGAVLNRLQEMHQQYIEYLDGLSTDELDWSPGPDMNSLCVLAVHVTAAERFWIGLGIDIVSTRDRPSEFVASGYELSALLDLFAGNIAFYEEAFKRQDGSRLRELVDVSDYMDRPSEVVTRGYAVLRGLDHTAEHLGHAGMTRQLLERR
jgi:hypothetical protein